MAATKAARSATSVLPKPTSPQISRSIGLPRRQVLQHVGDGARLVLGLGEGEAGAELVPAALGRRHARRRRGCARSAAMRISSPAMSRMRCFIRALRDCQAAPPSLSSATPAALAAEARQHLDVLDRQEQLVVAVVEQPQAVVRRAVDLQRHQPVVAADAVVLVHHQVALGDLGGLGDELVGPLAPARRAADALAEQVLLADQRRAARRRSRAPRPSVTSDDRARRLAPRPPPSRPPAPASVKPCSRSRLVSRSREPRVQAAITTRRPSSASVRACAAQLVEHVGRPAPRAPGRRPARAGRRHRRRRRRPAWRTG